MQTNRITVADSGIAGNLWAMSPFGNLARC
jgi:hypothetical protein